MRKGNAASASFRVYDVDDGSTTRALATVTFSTKVIVYDVGSDGGYSEWIDDDTVKLTIKTTGLIPANDNRFQINSLGPATQYYTYFTAAMAIDNTYPVPYVATSRTAINTSYNFRLPPSGRVILDIELFPYFKYDTSANPQIASWYVDSTHQLAIYYKAAGDTISIYWHDGGSAAQLNSSAFDDGTLRTINQPIRILASIDISEGSITTGSRLIIIPRNQGSISESTAWDVAIDELLNTTYLVIDEGHTKGNGELDGVFRHLRIYGGVFSITESLTTEAEIDASLDDHELILDQTHQGQFNFDTVAVLGHNIGEGADIKMEANDWNEWNYVDGSGSSIIQHSLTWDSETILKMITKTKKQYVKFTIDDPNNDSGVVKIGRFWVGSYLDIDPSSLDNFTVEKMRSDQVAYGINRQKFANVGTGWRRFNLEFPKTNDAMVTSIQTMYDEVGNHGSVIFCNFDTLRDYTLVSPVYCSIVGNLTFSHGGRQKYSYGLVLEEDK